VARVAYIREDEHPELTELISTLRGARRGRLLNLYRLLLYSPDVARTWLEHVSTVRWKTDLDGALREVIIIRVGYLNRAEYVISQHVPSLAEAEGLSSEQTDALADETWRDSPLFTAAQAAALAYTDAMTRQVEVPDAVFEALKPHFSERQILELTVLIGTYNMHTRVLRALEVDPEP
jgi:4-carboxymuconolactone decarboxylase